MDLERFTFQDIFQENPDGTLSPKRVINVNGVTLSQDVSFAPGTAIGGVDFHKFKGQPIAAEVQGSVLIIRGFYQA